MHYKSKQRIVQSAESCKEYMKEAEEWAKQQKENEEWCKEVAYSESDFVFYKDVRTTEFNSTHYKFKRNKHTGKTEKLFYVKVPKLKYIRCKNCNKRLKLIVKHDDWNPNEDYYAIPRHKRK